MLKPADLTTSSGLVSAVIRCRTDPALNKDVSGIRSGKFLCLWKDLGFPAEVILPKIFPKSGFLLMSANGNVANILIRQIVQDTGVTFHVQSGGLFRFPVGVIIGSFSNSWDSLFRGTSASKTLKMISIETKPQHCIWFLTECVNNRHN